MYKDLPYRKGVGIILLNNENKVFVGKRIDMRSEAWQMPQGGIDDGEEPEKAVIREMAEETGTDKAYIIAVSKDWYYYDLPDELVPKIWNGKFRGQQQKWFCLRFSGSDSDIDINTEHPEFDEWQWAEARELPNLIVPFKRQLYKDILTEFAEHLI
ncbi:MAG: RNA pyrophosphohydrolase [Rickettsiales bacterium]